MREAIEALPLFSDDELPATVAQLEAALAITLDGIAIEGADLGYVMLPVDDDQPLSRAVAWISIEYAWDRYHQHPLRSIAELRRAQLLSYTVGLTVDASACRARLEQRFGAPGRVKHDDREYSRFGPFFLYSRAGDSFSLSWYARTPDWAVRADDDARLAWIRQLIAALSSAATGHEVDAVVGGAPAEAGVVRSGLEASDDRISFELKPPMRAQELVAAFGWANTIGMSRDVHMSSWTIAEVIGADEYRLQTRAPRHGCWSVEAFLVRRPTGGACPECRAGGIGQHRLGEGDAVRSVRLIRS
jgi:hypothetical protein